jgi:3',5'-cyclic AMP phosphodiesterase CpdA
MRLAWLTDLHLNFVSPRVFQSLIDGVRAESPDAVLVGGDTGEAPNVGEYLRELAAQLAKPVYFVLGNHDFYRSSIPAVREDLGRLCKAVPNLSWLPTAGVVSLSDRTALVGHDGWGDGGYGDVANTQVILNDYFLIEDLQELSHADHVAKLRSLGREAADHVRRVLPRALERHEEVILLTHVPPFREACWHQGKISDDDWLPFFACRAVGDVLRAIMAEYPDRRLTVLCGHTHSPGECDVRPNLTVLTGGAVYGKPGVQAVFEV